MPIRSRAQEKDTVWNLPLVSSMKEESTRLSDLVMVEKSMDWFLTVSV